MERGEVHGLTAAYALDALGDAAEAEYEAHLRHCERCRDELAAFQEAATALAHAAPPAAPPPALRERILEQARSERPNVVPLRPRW
ncbi:MAG: anti-sigma factor, partial [Candidatus Limnocylindria bacterium]